MTNTDYRKAYDTAAAELESLLKEQERTEERILSLRKTMNVLSTLLQQGARDKNSPDYFVGRLEQVVQSTLTDDIRSIMNAGRPMTTSDVRDELNKLGHEMEKQSNPLATINAILNRLSEQGYVRETLTRLDGRKAWQRTAAQRPTAGQAVMRGRRIAQERAAKDKK